jgi:hypothetical protein
MIKDNERGIEEISNKIQEIGKIKGNDILFINKCLEMIP